MGLKDLLVPKWKNSNAAIRRAAIDGIENNPELLGNLAKTDPASEVRVAAINKIDDEAVLGIIVESEQDELVKKIAIKKREAIFEKIIATTTDTALLVSVFEKYGNEKVIAAYLCDHAANNELQNILVRKIRNPLLLCKIAEHKCSLETGESIVLSMNEKEYLVRIAQKASNKKIRLLAQNKIDTLFADPHAHEQTISKKLEQCIGSMNFKIGIETLEQGEELLDMARRVWKEHDPDQKHALAPKFVTAEKQLLEQIAQNKALSEMFHTLKSIADKAELLTKEPLESAAEKFNQLREQWEACDKTGLMGVGFETVTRRFARISSAIAEKIARAEQERNSRRLKIEAMERCCDDFEEFIHGDMVTDSQKYTALLSRWRTLSSSGAGTLLVKQHFADIEKKYEEKIAALAAQKAQAIARELDYVARLVQKMESAARAKIQMAGILYPDVMGLKRKWEKPYPLAREMKLTLEKQFADAYERFMCNYFEFKDQNSWQEWANENVKTKICDEIEQLEVRLQQGEPLTGLMRKLSALDGQWKKAGAHDRDSARDLDNKYAAVRARIVSLGYAKKAELLEAATSAAHADSGNDAADALKNIQKQWNDIGYLPSDIEKEIADAFYSLCNTFFEQRKEQHQKYAQDLQTNIAAREEICIEAEGLASSTNWKESVAAFTNLQKRWEESWPAPMKRSRELWQIFSNYRDLFFEKYDSFKQANIVQKSDLCDKAEQLLARLEQAEADVLTDGESETMTTKPGTGGNTDINYSKISSEITALQRAWKETGPVTKEHSVKLWNRFRGACEKIITRINSEQRRNFELKEALVLEAEAIAGSNEWDQTTRKMTEIRDQWKTIKPADRRGEQILWARLQAAGDAFFNRRREHFNEQKALTLQQIELREALCTDLELLVRIAGKGNMLKNAETASPAEILKKGIDLRNEIEVQGDLKKTEENIKRRAFLIMDKWEACTPGGGKEYYRLEKKYFALIDILRSR